MHSKNDMHHNIARIQFILNKDYKENIDNEGSIKSK
jgi:hypothetical protein